jgi:polar amino acid transport system permease protein
MSREPTPPKSTSLQTVRPPRPYYTNWRDNPRWGRILRFPWWAIGLLIVGILVVRAIALEEDTRIIFNAIMDGIGTTLLVTAIAFPLAIILGLIIALARLSSNIIAYQLATLYVEVIRGFPALVFLFWVALPLTIEAIGLLNRVGAWLISAGQLTVIGQALVDLKSRDVDNTFRVVVALVLAYASFISEVFRGGIESIEKGQVEAARALGMTGRQAMRHVILPQAIKRVIPPLGNDVIAMLKDSSLVSVLGVNDITNRARVYSASTFRFAETYNILAFVYLSLTLVLSSVVRWIEQRLKTE